MSQALKRDYDKQSFFALNLDDEGAVIKIDRLSILLRYFERRIDSHLLGNRPLPPWAEHSSHSVVEYKCPGGLPEADLKQQFYSLLGLICAELADENVTGLVFAEEHVIVPNDPSILRILRNPGRLDPKTLISATK